MRGQQNFRRYPQSGFTLVELMIGVTVGLFLTAGILGLFVSNKRVYTDTERFARLQENGRFAIDFLSYDLRLVNFWGEVRYFELQGDSTLGGVANDCSGSAAADGTGAGLWASVSSADSSLSCIDDALVVDGIPGDVLVIRYANPVALSDSDNDGALNADDGLAIGQPYILSNRQTGSLLSVRSSADYADVPGVAAGSEIPGGRAWEYRYYLYYIRDNGDDAPPTLARKRLEWDSGNSRMTLVTEDLIEGAEGLRVLFGADTDADGRADTVTPASGVGDWNSVVSAKVFLLLRTLQPDSQYQDSKTYQLGDSAVDLGSSLGSLASQGAELKDFRRIVVATTVNLRNTQLTNSEEL